MNSRLTERDKELLRSYGENDPGSRNSDTSSVRKLDFTEADFFWYNWGMKKIHKNPRGGLTEAGRQHFKKTEGANLKRPVKTGTNPRRVSFAARFAGMKGAERDSKGKPTRLLLALNAWGFRSKESAKNFANRHKKSKTLLS